VNCGDAKQCGIDIATYFLETNHAELLKYSGSGSSSKVRRTITKEDFVIFLKCSCILMTNTSHMLKGHGFIHSKSPKYTYDAVLPISQ